LIGQPLAAFPAGQVTGWFSPRVQQRRSNAALIEFFAASASH
jgi:hypothetical protein